MTRYPHVYELLKLFHTPAKAVEIIMDARRGDALAIKWIRTLRATSWSATASSSKATPKATRPLRPFRSTSLKTPCASPNSQRVEP